MKEKEGIYFKQLDGLRFIAVFMVMFAHYAQYQMGNVFITSIPFVYGVILFFVLSGFLITRILLKQKGEPILRTLKSFYIRRVIRIFPVFYVVLGLLYLFNYENTREIFPFLVSYTINVFESFSTISEVGNFNHIWSLAVEEQFYLIWPVLILLIRYKYFLRVTFALIILSLVLKLYLASYTSLWVWNEKGLMTNFYSLGMGGLLAYLSLEKEMWLRKLTANWLIVLSGFFALITIGLEIQFHNEVFKQVWMPFIWVLFFFVLIAKSTYGFTGVVGWFLSNKVVVYLGKISYGIYIIHQFIPSFFYAVNPDSIFIQNKYIGFVGFSVVTVLLASISWFVLEKPINGLKKNFKY